MSEDLVREGRVLREALGSSGRRRPRAPVPWRTTVMGALALLALVGVAFMVRDLWRPPREAKDSYSLVELTVRAHLPGDLPEGAVLSVMLADVPATVSRPVSGLVNLGEGRYQLVWQGELKRLPQQVRGRLQAPGWRSEETGEVTPERDGDSLTLELPSLSLRRPARVSPR